MYTSFTARQNLLIEPFDETLKRGRRHLWRRQNEQSQRGSNLFVDLS